jgi:hypothetical protein
VKAFRSLLLVAFTVPVLFSLSCRTSEDTSLVIHVVVDPALNLNAVDMTATRAAAGAAPAATRSDHFPDPSKVTWILFPGDGDKSFAIEVEARGLAAGASHPVVVQRASISFQKGQRIEITMTLDHDCVTVSCASPLTCQRGVCVDPGLVGTPADADGGPGGVDAPADQDQGRADGPGPNDRSADGSSLADGSVGADAPVDVPVQGGVDARGDVPTDRPDAAPGDARLPAGLGTVCAVNGDCASTHCVDGLCCNEACTGSCQQCDSTAMPGYCVAIAAGQPATAKRTACAKDDISTCKQTGLCDGKGSCQLYADGQVCKAATCDATANAISDSRCDGAGTCKAGVPLSCAPFRCKTGDAVCARTCTLAADCDGQPCLANSCGN